MSQGIDSFNWDDGFPVYIYKQGMELPKQGTYFVVSGNGIWLHKDEEICSGFFPVQNISCLDDLNVESFVNVKLPKIPANHIWKIKEFFRLIVEKYRAESEVTLYFNKTTNEYKIHVPPQTVTNASVKYKRIAACHLPEYDGFLRVGTIHSHCNFDAFHSGVDVGDELDFDGLHVTFGHNDKENFSISVSLVVNGHRSKVPPSDVLEGIVPVITEEKTDGFFDAVFGSVKSCEPEKFFKLNPIDENTRSSWSEEIKSWMEEVQGHVSFRYALKNIDSSIIKFSKDKEPQIIQPFNSNLAPFEPEVIVDNIKDESVITDKIENIEVVEQPVETCDDTKGS